jgi:ATP-dependent DNA helicase RecG
MDLVEQIGSGIRRIRDLCREYGVAKPKFDVSENWVTVSFPRATGEVASEVVGEVVGEVTGEVAGEVTRLLLACEGEQSRRDL